MLDGGEDVGFQTLVVLDQLMEAVRQVEGLEHQPKPCHYFDFIVGTSTGGQAIFAELGDPAPANMTFRLLAIMLGRLRMSIDECYEALLRLFNDIAFRKVPAARKLSPEWLSPKLNSRDLEEFIGQLVRDNAPTAISRGQDNILASNPV